MSTPVQIAIGVLGAQGAAAALGNVHGWMLKLSAGALTGAAAFAGLVKRAIDTADESKKMADRVNISVESFTELKYGASLAGAEVGDLQTAFRGLSDWAVRAGRDNEDLNELFLEQIDVLSRIPEGAARIAAANDRFGRSAMSLLPLVKGGTRDLRAMMKEAREFGVVIGPQFAKNADDFNDNLERMGAVVHGLFLRIADELLPEALRLTDWIIGSIKDYKAHQGAFETFLGGYKFLAQTFAGINVQIQATTTGVGHFIGHLWETLDPIESLSVAWDRVNGVLDGYGKRVEEIDAIGTRSAEDQRAAAAEVEISTEQRIRAIQYVLQGEQALNKFGDAARLSGAEFDKERAQSLESQIGQMNEIIRLTQQDIEEKAKLAGVEAGPKQTAKGVIVSKDAIESQAKVNALILARVQLQTQLDDIGRRQRTLATATAESAIQREAAEVGEIEADTTLRVADRRSQLTAALQRQVALFPALISALKTELAFSTPDEQIKIEERINQLLADRNALVRKITEVQPEGFLRRTTRAMDEMFDKWQQIGSNMADVMVDGVGSAVRAVADDITNAIFKTGEWGEAFAAVTRGIVRDIIQVSLQWAISRTVTAALERTFGAERKVAAKQELAVNTANAAASSGSSFGVSAILGLVAFLALMGAVAGFAGAFADGGRVRGPGGPRSDNLIVRVSNGEHITNAAAAARSSSLLEAIGRGEIDDASIAPQLAAPSPAALEVGGAVTNDSEADGQLEQSANAPAQLQRQIGVPKRSAVAADGALGVEPSGASPSAPSAWVEVLDGIRRGVSAASDPPPQEPVPARDGPAQRLEIETAAAESARAISSIYRGITESAPRVTGALAASIERAAKLANGEATMVGRAEVTDDGPADPAGRLRSEAGAPKLSKVGDETLGVESSGASPTAPSAWAEVLDAPAQRLGIEKAAAESARAISSIHHGITESAPRVAGALASSIERAAKTVYGEPASDGKAGAANGGSTKLRAPSELDPVARQGGKEAGIQRGLGPKAPPVPGSAQEPIGSSGPEPSKLSSISRLRVVISEIQRGALAAAQLHPQLPVPDYAASARHQVATAEVSGRAAGMTMPALHVPEPRVEVHWANTRREVEQVINSRPGRNVIIRQMKSTRGRQGLEET